MFKKILYSSFALLLSAMLYGMSVGYAQSITTSGNNKVSHVTQNAVNNNNNDNNNNNNNNDDDGGMDWGWIGLIGLAGLFGLRKNRND